MITKISNMKIDLLTPDASEKVIVQSGWMKPNLSAFAGCESVSYIMIYEI